MADIVNYCPMCVKRPEKPMNQDPTNLTVSIPKICLSCQAKNSTLIAALKDAGKVEMLSPGESALDREDQRKCLFNPHRLKKAKANRSKTQPP